MTHKLTTQDEVTANRFPFSRLKLRRRTFYPATRPAGVTEDVVIDERFEMKPSQMVEDRLIALLGNSSLPLSLRRLGCLCHRGRPLQS